MSSLFVERVNVVRAGLAVAVVYMISPVAARAATCDLMPRSFECLSGQQKSAEGMKIDTAREVKVAAVAPANIFSDAGPATAEQSAEPRRSTASRRNRGGKSGARTQTVRKGWRTRSAGFQARGGVVTSCFPGSLRSLLAQVASHYGRSLVITSGYRSPSHNRRIGGARESQHIHCLAADFYIPGVSPGTLAAYVKSLPGRGGVGTYCGNRTIHLDVGIRREWHWGCGGGSRHASRRHGRRVSRVMARYAAARGRG